MSRRNEINETPYEFILYINGNIICQRFFVVKGFNPKSLKSMDLKHTVDRCVDVIDRDFLKKTRNYLWGYYNPYDKQEESDIIRGNVYENEDIFEFEIKVNKRSIIKKSFTGNNYPPKVRYSVNIREIIPTIIQSIQKTLSQKNYVKTYGDLEL